MTRTWCSSRSIRAPNGASPPIPGSGPGLALARNAIEEMGGTLTPESELGRGNAFTISFPVPDPPLRSKDA